MYGKAGVPEFRHVEGYEDHSVYAMMTYDRSGDLTGIVVNVPCPAQVSEQIYKISADYWHETRQELRKRFGDNICILAQCAPAGDQSPHVLIGKRAEERMWRLKGRDVAQNAPREEIALKIANAISDIIPYAEREIEWNPRFEHRFENLDLPRRMITERDVEEALEEARPFNPNFSIEVHVVRIGDVAFATNPFALPRLRMLGHTVSLSPIGPYVESDGTFGWSRRF